MCVASWVLKSKKVQVPNLESNVLCGRPVFIIEILQLITIVLLLQLLLQGLDSVGCKAFFHWIINHGNFVCSLEITLEKTAHS